MRPRTAVLLAFGATLVYFTGFFPPTNNPNELSRIEAVVAWVETGTFSIDGVIPRLGDSMDKSVWNGRFYSNKAPGLIFAAIPIYRALRIFLPQPRTAFSTPFVLVRLATVSLVSLVALARLLRRLDRSGEAARAAPLIAFAAAFGTPLLYYARSLFSHAWTASLLFLAWDAVRASEERRGRRAAALLAAAGLLAGWAAISEYTAAPVAAALMIRAAVGAREARGRTLALFAAGAAPALLLLAVYDASCFGSPFRLSSACEAYPAYADLAKRSFFGVGTPSPTAAWGTLFSSRRGAMLFSPFLFWSAAGWWRWWRSREQRRDCLFVLAAVLCVWIPITGYANWDGGWSLGMRYLLPALLFVVLPIPWALTSPASRGLFVAAVVFASCVHVLATSSWPHFSESLAWPWASGSAWLVAHGGVAPNLGAVAGLSPRLSLLPIFLVIAGALALSIRAFPASRPSKGLAAFLGVVVFGTTLAASRSVPGEDRSWREDILTRLRAGERR